MRIMALVKRIMLQIARDKRTLALLFIAPLFILTLMNFVFNGKDVNPTIGLTGASDTLVEALEARDIEATPYEKTPAQMKNFLTNKNLDGFLTIDNTGIKLTLTNDNPTTAKTLQMKIEQLLQLSAQPHTRMMPLNVETHYIYGDEDTVLFDTFSPMLIGFFVFLFVFLISGIGLLNERTSGTLERLLATPIKRFEIIVGYFIGYGILALIQTIIVALFAVQVLDIVLVGSIWAVLLVNIVTALVALSLGILLSSFASSEFQMIQFIPLVIVPQIFFCGIFPIDGMADWLQQLAYVMPLYYAADALKGIMYMGETVSDIATNLYVLLGFIIVFVLLNLVVLKKYRKR